MTKPRGSRLCHHKFVNITQLARIIDVCSVYSTVMYLMRPDAKVYRMGRALMAGSMVL